MSQISHPLPTVLILASGRGERFLASGGQTHKLQALLHGKTVLQHTLDAVMASGLPWHVEDAGHPGMGDSIAAALAKTSNAAGWLILPADLPLVQPQTLLAVAQALQTNDVVQPCYLPEGDALAVAHRVVEGGRIIEQFGHPVGFAAVCRQDLLKLRGMKGAAGVIKQYSAIKLIVNDIGIVTDIDTLDDLKHATELIQSRLGVSSPS